MRGLVADADPRALHAINLRLQANEFNVDRASLASEALDLSERNEIVLFELVLPDLSGRQLVQRMRDANRLRPILVLSSLAQWQTRAAVLEAGADGFPIKPFWPGVTAGTRPRAIREIRPTGRIRRRGHKDAYSRRAEPAADTGAAEHFRRAMSAATCGPPLSGDPGRGGALMPGDRERGSVLLVEDDSHLAEMLRSELEESGYIVEQALEASSARALLRSHPLSTVLLDCHLPGGGMKELMALADQRRVPVVLVTGDIDMLSQLAAFGYPHLLKPFQVNELLESVAETQRGVSTSHLPESSAIRG